MTGQIITLTLNPYFLGAVVLVYGIIQGLLYLKKTGHISLPDSAMPYIEKLGWDKLVDAYNEAEKNASLPNTKRDYFVDIIQKLARTEFGAEIPDHLANFICEYVVAIMKMK